MIDFIEGEIAYSTAESIVIAVGGIGYNIFCPNPDVIGRVGERIRIYTHQHVREDLIALYGFTTQEERELFRQLLGVSGIGPKGAMAVIGSGHPAEVVQAIYEENIQYLTKLPGIGKKTAQRIILDLKDKLELDVWLNRVVDAGSHFEAEVAAATSEKGVLEEAIEALIGLGYNEKEARHAVSQAQKSAEHTHLSIDTLIKKALQTFLT